MASWDDLRAYIHSNYSASDVSARAIEMSFGFPSGSSQSVYVSSLEGPDGAIWASIDSPIGLETQVDLFAALRMVEDVTCGGLAHLFLGGQDVVVVRHAVPLATLDPEEFNAPLRMVTAAADAFAQALVGTDQR